MPTNNTSGIREVDPKGNQQLVDDLKRVYYNSFKSGYFVTPNPVLQKALDKAIKVRTRWASETLTGPLGEDKKKGPVYNFPSESAVNVKDTVERHEGLIESNLYRAKKNIFKQPRDFKGNYENFAYAMEKHTLKKLHDICTWDLETMVLPLTEDLKAYLNKAYKTTPLKEASIAVQISRRIGFEITGDNILVPWAIGIYYSEAKEDLTNLEFDNQKVKIFKLDNVNGSSLDIYKKSEKLFLDFIEYIEDVFTQPCWKKRNVTVYAHNAQNFDNMFFTRALLFSQRLTADDPMWKVVIQKNVPATIIFNKRIKFKDSFRMFKESLNNLGKNMVNETKSDFITGEITYAMVDKFYSDKSELDQALAYLIQDCFLLKKVMSTARKYFFDLFTIDLAQKNTIASLAVHVFLSNFYPFSRKKLPKKTSGLIAFNSPSQEEGLRESFYGGRNEIYLPYMEKGKKYDINSSYPACMAEFPMPLGTLLGPYKVSDPIGFAQYELANTFGFVKCKVFTHPKNTFLPLLPHRTKELGTFFPQGTWTGWYFSEEVKMARQCGYIVEVLEVIYASPETSCFKGFVEKIYNMRQEFPKPDARNYILKVLLNSVFGRWGLKVGDEVVKIAKNDKQLEEIRTNYSVVYEEPFNLAPGIKVYLVTHLAQKNFQMTGIKKDPSQTTINSTRVAVHICSAITSYGRLRPYGLLKKFARKQIAYFDTDGFIMSSELPSSLISANTLGLLKDEQTLVRAYCLQQKFYAYSYFDPKENKEVFEITVAGVTEAQKADITENSFKELLENPGLTNLDLNNPDTTLSQLRKSTSTFTISSQRLTKTISLPKEPKTYIRILDENGKWVNTKSILVNENQLCFPGEYNLLFSKQLEKLVVHRALITPEAYKNKRLEFYRRIQTKLNFKNLKLTKLIKEKNITSLSELNKVYTAYRKIDPMSDLWKDVEIKQYLNYHQRFKNKQPLNLYELKMYKRLEAKWLNSGKQIPD